MALNSGIEWTDHTANLWWGCTHVHRGCDNCYAEVWANRYGTKWGDNAPRREIKSVWGNLFVKTDNLLTGIEWLIQGGESGPKKRPFDTFWAKTTMAQCQLYGVKYFFKQIDKVQPIPEFLQVRELPNDVRQLIDFYGKRVLEAVHKSPLKKII
jgi:protein gp37